MMTKLEAQEAEDKALLRLIIDSLSPPLNNWWLGLRSLSEVTGDGELSDAQFQRWLANASAAPTPAPEESRKPFNNTQLSVSKKSNLAASNIAAVDIDKGDEMMEDKNEKEERNELLEDGDYEDYYADEKESSAQERGLLQTSENEYLQPNEGFTKDWTDGKVETEIQRLAASGTTISSLHKFITLACVCFVLL